jgi:Guanine nucleotide exchange factor in Golgi transport N-terminal
MFIVDGVVEEDCRVLLPSGLDSTPPDTTTLALGPTSLNAFAIFEDLYLLGNGERPQSLQLEYPHKTFALKLVESVLTNYHKLFRVRKVCLSSPLPIRDLYASSYSLINIMFTAFQALTLITLQYHLFHLLLKCFPACPPRHPSQCCLPLAQRFFSELETEVEVIRVLAMKIMRR